LSSELHNKLDHLSKRIYRALYLSGYARLDFRLTTEGEFYLLEANPNPNLSFGEDFAEAAEHEGVHYDELLHRVITHGLGYQQGF
jgi:D-alanine-D-alanine ligase